MINLGTALKSTVPPHHRFLVISDPQGNGGQVVLVCITTHDRDWPDQDCILGPDDWDELDRPSTVAYSTCNWGPALSTLESAVVGGRFERIRSPSDDVLRKVIESAHRAERMPPGAKKWLAVV